MIRDFIYLDVPRLQSFASQLLEGLPESQSHSRGHQADFAGEVKAGLPGIIGASANTKAVLSASSTVTSTVHHRLVGLVVDELRGQGYLARPAELLTAADGTFALLSGRLQITDPTALRAIFEDWAALERNINALQAGPEASLPKPSRADRRAGRSKLSQPSLSKAYTDALVGVLRTFAEDSVRIRVLDDQITLAIAIAEREKFVEDLERLTARHGFVMSGHWEVLGQVNASVVAEPIDLDEQHNLMDIIESAAGPVLKSFTDVSGTGDTGDGTMLTPLAIYRKIDARDSPDSIG